MKNTLNRSKVKTAYWFLTPLLFVLCFVAAWPLANTIFFSFTDASLSVSEREWNFVGFNNYYNHEWGGLLQDSQWWRAVFNTVRFALISVSFETVLGLGVALLLNQQFKGRGLLRAAVLIPWAIPTVVSAKMWAWMLHDQFGVLNTILLSAGIITKAIAWTANPDTAMWAIIMVDVWKTTPFMTLLILAGLQMLPLDCYEAARVDGISPIKVFCKVTLPLVWPAIAVAIIFRLLDSLRIFDLIYVLTSNSEDTMSMSVYARQQMVDFQDVGYGSAASTTLFIITALLTSIYIMMSKMDISAGKNR